MRIVMIAALAAAQLSAAALPARAAELPGEAAATQKAGIEATELGVGRQTPAHAAAAQEERAEAPRKKRKSTGDKVLTGAAIVLGVGALAVGGLLIAIFS